MIFSIKYMYIYAFEVVVKQFNVLTVTIYKKSSVHVKKIQDIQDWQNLYIFIVICIDLFTCDRWSVIYILSTLKSAFRKSLFYNHSYIYL